MSKSGPPSATEEWQSYTTICRLCMQRDGYMLGIFNHIQGKEKSISKKIMDCTALEVTSGDGLPNSICHRCLYKIEFCLEFRQQCFVSDATLRQINGLSKQMLQVPFPAPDQQKNDVVMVVDPNSLDYESDYESDAAAPGPPPEQPPSDVEATEFEFKNVFMCKFCDRAFVDKTECSNHENDSHDSVAPYRCQPCDMNFADRLQYSAHLKSVHQNDKPYNCPECERTFARRSDLRKHTIVHTGIKPFTCHICLKSFSRNTNLSKHIRIHNGQKPFVCHSCPRTFMSKLELTRHSVLHAGVKPFKCNYCPMSFMRKDKLTRHQKRHFPQEKQDKTQELRLMRENLPTEYGYNNNADESDDKEAPKEAKEESDAVKEEWPSTENMVIDIDPFNNEVSDQNESTTNLENPEGVLEAPQPTESIQPEEKPTSDAESDPKTTPQHVTGDCSDPVTVESPQSPQKFPCSLCSKRFLSQESLQVHMGLHNGDRPFACLLCTKAFLRKRELERHMATHTGMKPFKCTHCEKRFGRKDKLVRHMRIHDANAKKEHICFICGASFNRKDGLAHHMKSHVKEEDDGGLFVGQLPTQIQ